MCTSLGSQPMMFVVRCTVGSSVRTTLATTYGGSKPGSHGWAFTVNATTVPRPETSVGFQDRLRHSGQIGVGGWTSEPQSSQPWMRRQPSAPDVQNHWFAGVSWGSGLTAPPSPTDAAWQPDGRSARGLTSTSLSYHLSMARPTSCPHGSWSYYRRRRRG